MYFVNCKVQDGSYTSVRICVNVRSINVRTDMDIIEGCRRHECAVTLPGMTLSEEEVASALPICEVAALDVGTEL